MSFNFMTAVTICSDFGAPPPKKINKMVKHLPTMQETRVQSLGQEDLLEKKMATHSSILTWKLPWMEEPGRPQFMSFEESDTYE